MPSTSAVIGLLRAIVPSQAVWHAAEQAHRSSERVVFTVFADSDGIYEATLTGGAERVLVNGRKTEATLDEQGRHSLDLRSGLNTVAYHGTMGMEVVNSGLHVPDASGAPATGGKMPFVTVQAEDSKCTGEVVGPTYESYSEKPQLPTEASGRQACQLQKAGDYVEFAAPTRFNALSLRYSIPDSPSGGGLQMPVSLKVAGKAIPDVLLTSEYSWFYGTYPFTNDPGQGKAHHFYDEVRVHLGSSYPAGAKVRVSMKASVQATDDCSDLDEAARQDCGFADITKEQCKAKGCCYTPTKDPSNPHNYPWCFFHDSPSPSPTPPAPAPPAPTPTPPAPEESVATVDLLDFYNTPDPYLPPSGAVSVLDHGADPTGAKDSSHALAAAIATAGKGGSVWIPEGKYTIGSIVQLAPMVSIHGAGPWHTSLHGTGQKVGQGAIGFYATYGSDGGTAAVGLYDFAIVGDVRQRNDGDQVNGVGGAPTKGSTLQNLWIQHTKCGLWLDGPGTDLLVTGNVVRDTTADGINLHIGWTGATIEQNSLRNTGDDGIALWSEKEADSQVTMRDNTVQLPILANGIVAYGGHDNTMHGNLVEDSIQAGGCLHVGNRFNAVKLSGTTTLSSNVLNRCGCEDMNWRFGVGAIWFYALDGPMEGRIVVSDTEINDSPYNAVGVIGNSVHGLEFQNVTVKNVATFVFQAQCDGNGSFENVKASGVGFHGVYGCSSFSITDAGGNDGWLQACDSASACGDDEQCPDNFKFCEHCGWPSVSGGFPQWLSV